VELILIDVRPEEEYQRGQVGQEYEGRGAKFTVVYMDPTVLMRNEWVRFALSLHL
jgi:ubiquitin carboxyl-terminal hydrolase 8